MKKKGQAALFISFLIASLTILLIASVVAPMGARFSSELFVAGENILADANETVSQIQNDTIRTSYANMISSAMAASDTNIEVTTDLYQYAWILIIALTAIVAFLFTRNLVEYGYSGGLI